jgi:glucokinase
VAEAAAAGDEISCGILDRAGYFIGVALSSYLHIFRPDLIVLAGGVSKAGDLLRIPIRRTLDQIASPFYLARLHGIEFSILVPIGAAIGCASTILYPDQFLPLPPSLS